MSSPDETLPSRFPGTLSHRRWRRLRTALSVLIVLVTSWFVGKQAFLAYAELQSRTLFIRYEFLALAVTLNVLGAFALAGPFVTAIRDRERLLHRRHPLPLSTIMQGYLMSQAGKYVPGKAVVMVIRLMVLGRRGAPADMIVLATFFETMVAMASAGLLATILMSLPMGSLDEQGQAQQQWARAASFFLFLGLIFFVLPPVLSLGPKVLSRFIPSVKVHADTPIGWRSIGKSIAISIVAWMIVGTSFWATVQAVSPATLGWSEIPTLSSVYIFSYVAGFISMVPGHFGVREFIMDSILRPLLGGDRLVAVSATILSRMVTLTIELVMALIAYACYRASLGRTVDEKATPSLSMERTTLHDE
ncbi:hypothetical protein K2X85_19530 [bacterium]|nr:hypothetical protein [bacterium]